MKSEPLKINKITAEELLENDSYRVVTDKVFRKIKFIQELPNSYHVPPVGNKILVVTDYSNESLLKDLPVEIIENA